MGSINNLTEYLPDRGMRYLEAKYNISDKCYEAQFLARAGYFVLMPLSIITCAIDTIIGIGFGLANIFTGGTRKGTAAHTKNFLESSIYIIAEPYQCLLQLVNPRAGFEPDCGDYFFSTNPNCEDSFLTEIVREFLCDKAEEYRGSDNSFFKRHIASRLTYALLTISLVISRIADGVIGVVAAPFAVLTFGKFEILNNLAFQGLKTPGIISDLVLNITCTVNPWAEEGSED